LDRRFEGKVAIVTGAGRGIGRAIALRLASEGAFVAAANRTPANAHATARLAHGTGAVIEPFEFELSSVESVRAMVGRVVDRFGRIDVLVNNAGLTGTTASLIDVTPEEWDGIFALNARGTFFCMQAVVARMINAGGGRIVNITSTAGKGSAGARSFSYAAAKGSVEVMTRMAAIKLAPYNIAVNAVAPGSTRAGAYLARMVELAKRQSIDLAEAMRTGDGPIPVGRSNEPGDVAGVVAFLASDEARNITGQSWNVDGGLLWGR
jgi:NAD(P)-dependent dehydrogenase (short-subunit alcohol dehydrogenase family)